MDFYEKLDALVKEEILTWPEDKQKHFTISKALVLNEWPKSETYSCMAVEIIFGALYIGLEKELSDKGLDKFKYDKLIEGIRHLVRELDYNIRKDGLDQGDINADLLGIFIGAFKNLYANRQS